MTAIRALKRLAPGLVICVAMAVGASAVSAVALQAPPPTCGFVLFPSDTRFVRGEFALNDKDNFPVVAEATFKKGFVFVIKGYDRGRQVIRPKALTMMDGRDWRLFGGQFSLSPDTTYAYRIPTSGNAVQIAPATQNELARFKTTYGATMPSCKEAPLGLSIQ